jgi:hypothetical protein
MLNFSPGLTDAGWRLDNPCSGANRQPRAAREQCELIESGKSTRRIARELCTGESCNDLNPSIDLNDWNGPQY